MKKISFFLGLAVALSLVFSSCTEGTDFDVEMITPLDPVGGQYYGFVYGIEDSSKSDADCWKSLASSVSYDAENDVLMSACGEIEYVSENYCYLSNTTDFATDKCWLRFGAVTSASFFNINCKLDYSPVDYSFKGTAVGNYRGNSATPRGGENVSVSGLAFHNTYKTETGGIDDELVYTFSLEDQPGMHYIVWAFKNTLWDEDFELNPGPELVRVIKEHALKL